jgi:hypothetical protein
LVLVVLRSLLLFAKPPALRPWEIKNPPPLSSGGFLEIRFWSFVSEPFPPTAGLLGYRPNGRKHTVHGARALLLFHGGDEIHLTRHFLAGPAPAVKRRHGIVTSWMNQDGRKAGMGECFWPTNPTNGHEWKSSVRAKHS